MGRLVRLYAQDYSKCLSQRQACHNRSHIQKLACNALQDMRIAHRWDAIQQANDEMEEAKLNGDEYEPFRFPNGDTLKELLIRSRYLLFKSSDKWTKRQKEEQQYSLKSIPA